MSPLRSRSWFRWRHNVRTGGASSAGALDGSRRSDPGLAAAKSLEHVLLFRKPRMAIGSGGSLALSCECWLQPAALRLQRTRFLMRRPERRRSAQAAWRRLWMAHRPAAVAKATVQPGRPFHYPPRGAMANRHLTACGYWVCSSAVAVEGEAARRLRQRHVHDSS